MFILDRRIGETIMIGDNVAVTILGTQGNQVRLGVNSPKHVDVHREETYNRIFTERNDSTFVETEKRLEPSVKCGKGSTSFHD